MNQPQKARMMPDITAVKYHAETFSTHPMLSASTASTLIGESPYHAWLFHPKLGKLEKKQTNSLEWGTVLHALILGKGQEQIEVIDARDYRTNAAKEARDNALALGKTPIKIDDYERAETIAQSAIDKINEAGFALDEYDREQVITWEEETALRASGLPRNARLASPEFAVHY